MLEDNEKGDELRQYFIDCEKKLLTQNMLPDFSNPAVAARAWATEFEAKQLAMAQLEQAKPKLEAWEQYLSLDGTMLATDFAKSVGLSSAVTLNNFLINKGILCKKTNAKGTHTARAGYEEWFKKVARPYTDLETGEDKTAYQLRISGLGIEKLRSIVQEGFATGELKKSKSK